jgi:hypothetical protein
MKKKLHQSKLSEVKNNTSLLTLSFNLFLIMFCCLFFNLKSTAQITTTTGGITSVTFSTAGSSNWTPPAGVTSITVEAWGAGGGGGGAVTAASAAAGGGGGGAYTKSTPINVTSTAYSIVVGTGGIRGTSAGSNGADGNNSSFDNTLVVASGGKGGSGTTTTTPGTGGAGGAISGPNDFVKYFGGNGAAGLGTSSGGGGSSAGTSSVGTNGGNRAGGIAPTGGGNGGSGGSSSAGSAGLSPGGGGGGGRSSSGGTGYAGGAGADGKIIISYAAVDPIITITSSLTSFSTTSSNPSSSQSFTVSGLNLTGNVNLSVGSPSNFELSTDNNAFSNTVSITATGTLVNTPVYVRLKTGLSQGAVAAENITATSTGAANVTLSVSGAVVMNYYFSGSGDVDLNTVALWFSNSNYTGTNPVNFTADAQAFVIQSDVTTAAPWGVSGAGSKIVLGDPSKTAVTLTVGSGAAVTGPLDVAAALSSGSNKIIFRESIQHSSTNTIYTNPTWGNLDPNTVIEFNNTANAVLGGSSNLFNKSIKAIRLINAIASINAVGGNTPTLSELFVDETSTFTAGSNSNSWINILTGGTVTINGKFATAKSGGAFANVSSPTTTTAGALNFLSTSTTTLGNNSIIEYIATATSSGQVISQAAYKNLSLKGTNKTLSGSISANTTNLALTNTTTTYNLNTDGNSQTLGTLSLTDNTTINLNSASHTITFSDSQAATWISGKTLTITGWTGALGSSGTGGKIFFGSNASGLTTAQLSQITFTGYSSVGLLSTGELVPLTTLPINLTSFTGKNENSSVRLSWSTSSEQNNDRFEVLRAGEDQNFKKIGSVQGNGNANNNLYYNFDDRTPLAGDNYYKLKQIDFDGKSEEFGPIVIKTDIKSINFEVYATKNNADVSLNILGIKAEKVTIKIFDLTGRKLTEKTFDLEVGNNQFNLNMLNMSEGIYVATLTTDQNFLSKKFYK